jgi:hypothetical protein
VERSRHRRVHRGEAHMPDLLTTALRRVHVDVRPRNP